MEGKWNVFSWAVIVALSALSLIVGIEVGVYIGPEIEERFVLYNDLIPVFTMLGIMWQWFGAPKSRPGIDQSDWVMRHTFAIGGYVAAFVVGITLCYYIPAVKVWGLVHLTFYHG